MSEKAVVKAREKWVDDVKVIAAYWLYWGISFKVW